VTADHLPMADPGHDRLARWRRCAWSYAVHNATADDAEGEASRAADRAREARMWADDARAEMRRAWAALTDDERATLRREAGT
jgi:hypothetical protein